MKRPAFQFYPHDWMSDLKLRRCSPAARGVWMDVICALHDSDDGYGLLRWPLKEIASTVGASMANIREIVSKGVLRGSDDRIDEPFVYVPRSGRRDGEPVVLVAAQAGPLWYSARLVRDEYVRIHRGESTRFEAVAEEAPKPAPKASRKQSPKPTFGDGSSTSSSASLLPPNSPPEGGEVRSGPVGLKAWLEAVKAAGEKPVPEGDPVFAYADKVGLPEEFLALAWRVFRRTYTESRKHKRYRDWRQAFRNAVEGNWLKLWWLDPSGAYSLTTAGMQAKRAHEEAA